LKVVSGEDALDFGGCCKIDLSSGYFLGETQEGVVLPVSGTLNEELLDPPFSKSLVTLH